MNTANQCRAMGLGVGDTIEGREEAGSYWEVTRLTLLWLGEEVAVFREQSKSSSDPNWSEPEESADWTLECRDWMKVAADSAEAQAASRRAAA